MVNYLLSLLMKSPPQRTTAKTLADLSGKADEYSTLVSGDQMLALPELQPLVQDIQRRFGQAENTYREYLWPLMVRTMDIVQLLPASKTNHHDKPGGLAVHTLEVLYQALRSTDDHSQLVGETFDDISVSDCRLYSRVLLAANALAHDLGKIAYSIKIYIIGPDNERHRYNPHLNGRYMTTIIEAAENLYGTDFRDVNYFWVWPDGRDKDHSKDAPIAANALISGAKLIIPHAELLTAFTTRESSYYRSVVWPIVEAADHASSRQEINQRQRPVDHDQRREAIVYALRCFCRKNLLHGCPIVDGHMFLSMASLRAFLMDLPNYDDFSCIPTDPHNPENFAEAIRTSGLAKPSGTDLVADNRYPSHNGAVGLFLSLEITNQVRIWQYELDRSTSERAEEPPPLMNDPDIGAEELPADSAGRQPVSQDIAKHGKPIASAPLAHMNAVAGQQAECDVHSAQLAAAVSDYPDIPPILLHISLHLERADLDPSEPEPDRYRFADGGLIIFQPWLDDMIEEADLLLLDTSNLRSDAANHFGDRFCFPGTTAPKQLECTVEYSQALLNKTASHPLLVSGVPMTLQNSSSARSFGEGKRDANTQIVKPAQSPSLKPHEFLSKLTSHNNISDLNKLIFVDGERLGIPFVVVDRTLDGQASLRGALQQSLKADGLWHSRSKKTLFLDLNNEIIKSWHSDLKSKT